jgi:hypothetical protein
LNDLSLATPFQHPQWLDTWYGAFTGPDDVEPLIAIICDAATGEQVALLPLMALLDSAGPCSLNGNIVTTGDDFDAWRYTLERTVRKERAKLAGVDARPRRGDQDRYRKKRSVADSLDHGDPAGHPNAAPRVEFHSQ